MFFIAKKHCVKCVRIRSYFGPPFPAFGLNTERYGVSLPPYAVQMRKNTDQKTPNTDFFHAVYDDTILI